jgi:hypothetical protein
MKRTVLAVLLIIAVVLAVLAVKKCPFLGLSGDISGVSSIETRPAEEASVKVELERGELVMEDGMWDLSYDVVSEGELLFTGNIRSRNVIAPYVQDVRKGVVVIRYKGVSMPAKKSGEKDPDDPSGKTGSKGG